MALYENIIRLKGFVGKDAEIKNAANGSLVIFSLATKSGYKDKDSGEWISHTDWHRIVSFGKPADFAKQLKKGDYVEVSGELRSSDYEGSDNSKHRSWEIRASRVSKLERPTEADPTNDSAD